jgi:transcriptional regulator with XRE-family HTH domain
MSRRLKAARTDAGFTQQDLADLTGIALKTVNNYENSTYARARKPYVVRTWAEACGRDFEELWGPSERPLDRSGWLGRTPHHQAA